MKVSVVVNVHSGTRIKQFVDAAESVLSQTYDALEFVVVVSDAPEILDEIRQRYEERSEVVIVALDPDDGLSAARNAGVEAADGDIVAFTDDDVLADPDWISQLVAIYEAQDPAGVGGHVVPIWPDEKPWYLPPEFYWLVGVMHDNFVANERPQPVRNTFGCNISFDREAFLDAGGFREHLGKNQDNPLQGEEAELCERIDGEFWYTPDALVRHRVDRDQTSVRYLLDRAFWQGYSKAFLADDMSDESAFLTELVTDSIPRRLRRPTPARLGQIGMLLSLTVAVALGFLYGKL